jgi:hypothetical protein
MEELTQNVRHNNGSRQVYIGWSGGGGELVYISIMGKEGSMDL